MARRLLERVELVSSSAQASTPSPLGLVRHGLLILVALLLLFLGYEALERRIQAFRPLGFEVEEVGDHWRVRSVDGVDGIRPGDRILLVDGVEVPSVRRLRARLGRAPESELVILRGDAVVRVAYRRPPLDVDWPYLALASIGAIYFGIGIYTLWRTREGTLFFLWCLASAVLYVDSPVFPLDRTGRAIFLADQLARLLVPPLTLHLFVSIARGRTAKVGPWLPWIYLPAVLLAGVHFSLAIPGPWSGWWYPSLDGLRLLDRLELVHLAGMAVAALEVLRRRLREVEDWEARRQLLWLLIGAAAGYAPFLVAYGLPTVLGLRLPEVATLLAVLPLAAVPVAFAYSVLRYRLWDLGPMLRTGISYGLTFLIAIAGFSLVHGLAERLLPEPLELARQFASFAGAAMVVGLAIPVRRGIYGALERLEYGSAHSRRQALARLGGELLRERRLDRLTEALVRELTAGLELERVGLWVERRGCWTAVSGVPAELQELPSAEIPLLLEGKPFRRIRAEGLPGEQATLEQQLFRAGFRYLFAMEVHGQQVGFLATGLRRGGQPLDSRDVELARGLLVPAALAIENARLLAEVQEQLEQVERMQREQEGILESSPAGIAVVDPEGRIVTANEALARAVGRTRDELLGEAFAGLLPGLRIPDPSEPPLELTAWDARGRKRWLQLSAAPLRGAEAAALRVVVVQDQSERVALAQALEERERLASLGMLAAGVAHEVNTPLTGISSYAQMLLADTTPDDPRRATLEKIERQTFRASRIVNALLDFARQPVAERQRVNLGELVHEVRELLGERAQKAQATIYLETPPEPVHVHGSPSELQQVLTNLLANAIDATAAAPPGEIRVRLSLDGLTAVVDVEDNGPGLPEELLDGLFRPFFSTKRASGGTGLGLAISLKIAERHGGRLQAQRRPEGGSRFRFTLPAAWGVEGSDERPNR